MTANLMGRRGAEARALAALVEREAPDVLALQELAPEQALALAATGLFPFGGAEPLDDLRGSALLLRHPGEVRRLPLPQRNGWIAALRLPASGAIPAVAAGAAAGAWGLEIISVHITPPHHLPPWEMARQRQEQVRALRAHLALPAAQPRVLLGDLNSTSLFPAYRVLTASLTDAALAAASRNGGRTYPTWAPRPGWPRLLRIDHALVDRSLHVESLRVLDLPGSDHAAVLIEVVIVAGL
jgi:endonuclease/exonuclease/phosphatase family metal-dependent hydrolase